MSDTTDGREATAAIGCDFPAVFGSVVEQSESAEKRYFGPGSDALLSGR
jgi:hypothetical protein